MKKTFLGLCFCFSLLYAGHSSDAVDDLKDEHKAVNDTHEAHLRELNNIKEIMKITLVGQANIIFEMGKEAELLFLTMQAEGEWQIAKQSILNILGKHIE